MELFNLFFIPIGLESLGLIPNCSNHIFKLFPKSRPSTNQTTSNSSNSTHNSAFNYQDDWFTLKFNKKNLTSLT